MSSQWTNKYNIMRDLSMVQGCVPADIDDPLTSGDKPPTVTLTEDTEEEFFRNCTAEGDIAGPDLGLIRQMLDMVREIDVSSDAEDIESPGKVIQITKLDPMTPPFVPKLQNLDNTTQIIEKTRLENTPKKKHLKKQEKQNRNVALTSILQLAGSIVDNEPKKLLKPVDFSPIVTESVKKVNGWLAAQEKNSDTLETKDKLCLDPIAMFRKKKKSTAKEFNHTVKSPESKKNVPTDAKEILNLDPSAMFRKKVSPNVVTVVECNKATKLPRECGQYVPSSHAEENYKKYLERSKMQKMVHGDIWTQAERQMKEIDEERRKQAELFQQSYIAAQLAQTTQSSMSESAISSQTYTVSTESATILNESPAMLCKSPAILSASSTILSGSPAISPETSAIETAQPSWELTPAEEQRLAVVRLPHHRHILTADCTVCRVRQESQDEKVIHVIDTDDNRLLKSTKKDEVFEEIRVPTWRDDEKLKAWHYDDETNTWRNTDESPKSCDKEKEPQTEREHERLKSSEREKKQPESWRNNTTEVQLRRKDNVDVQKSENSDMETSKNDEPQLCRTENNEIEDTKMRNNELDCYSVDSLESVSE